MIDRGLNLDKPLQARAVLREKSPCGEMERFRLRPYLDQFDGTPEADQQAVNNKVTLCKPNRGAAAALKSGAAHSVG
jgi:hypothetical protein